MPCNFGPFISKFCLVFIEFFFIFSSKSLLKFFITALKFILPSKLIVKLNKTTFLCIAEDFFHCRYANIDLAYLISNAIH